MQLLRGHKDRVRGVAYAPDGESLASCGDDGAVILWDVASGRRRKALRGHQRIVYDVAFAPSGGVLASAGGDRTIRLWAVPSGESLLALEGHDALVTSLAFGADGETLLSGAGNSNGQAAVWRWTSEERRIVSFAGGVWCVAYAAGGPLMAIGLATVPGEVVLCESWDVKAMARLSQRSRARSLGFSPDGRVLAVADGRGVNLWGLGSGQPEPPWPKPRATLTGHAAPVRSLAFAPDGRSLATAAHDGTVRLWDAASGAERACLDWGVGKVDCVAFSPDGMTIAAGGEKDIVIWDLGGASAH